MKAHIAKALAHDRQGRFPEAYTEFALALQLAKDLPTRARLVGHLALCMGHMGRYHEALHAVTDQRNMLLGMSDCETVDSLRAARKMADFMFALCNKEAAQSIRENVVNHLENMDCNPTDLCEAYLDLARSHRDAGNYGEAMVLYDTVLGATHVHAMVTFHALMGKGIVLRAQGFPNEAFECYRKAWFISAKHVDISHPCTAQVFHNMAVCLKAMDKHAAASSLREHATAIAMESLGPNHPSVKLMQA